MNKLIIITTGNYIIHLLFYISVRSLTLKEEHSLMVFENRVLQRKLHNEVFIICSSPNIIRMIKLRRMRWAGHVAHMGK
jgi:hypothetical protein